MNYFANRGVRTALVTGASRGLGLAIKAKLESCGVRVYSPIKEELDLSSASSVNRFVSNPRFPQVDILINNASINRLASVEEIGYEKLQETMQINLTAPMLLIKACSVNMKKKNWGRIVNISSMFCEVFREHRSLYSASKSGLLAYTKTMALELGPYGVLANSVGPGFVATDLTFKNNDPNEIENIADKIPLRRFAHPNEIAELVCFLVSEKNTYVTGQNILIDGGYSLQ